jgi:flagellar basal body-associated protein FliL
MINSESDELFDMQRKQAAILAITIMAIIAIGSIAVYAAYTMQSPTITVNPQPTPTPEATLSIQASTLTPYINQDFTVTVHVSDNTAGLPVNLYKNGSFYQTQNTDASGNAVFTLNVSENTDLYAVAEHQ